MSPFLYTFFGGGEYGGGAQFFKFFSKYFDSVEARTREEIRESYSS